MELAPKNLKSLIYHRKLYDVVKLSVELRIYDKMRWPVTLDCISGELGVDDVFLGYLLDVLAASGYAEKMERGGITYYKNTAVSEHYLNSKSPSFVGDAVLDDPGTYEALWGYVDEGPGDTAITKDYWTPELLKSIGSFALLGHVQAGVDRVDLSGRKKMLDVGGGHGLFSIFFTKKYPGLKAWVLDLPAVAGLARENIERYGAADRVNVIPGDFQGLKPGDVYDAIFISNVTASYDELCMLISNARRSLRRGGVLVLRNYVSDAGMDEWSPLITLERYSRRGRRGFSKSQLRSAMKAGCLVDIKLLYKGDGVAILSGVNR
ncbi:MAG TPA: methyltransferase [Methanocella sp.]|nr:methyltransferase [Methanocella sp.]